MLYKESYRALKKKMPIVESQEEMVEIPQTMLRFTPHPYQSVGAIYRGYTPFYLRKGVVQRLENAQDILQKRYAGYRLKIFDGYRPLSVQSFMIEYDSNRLAQEIYKKSFLALEEQDRIYIEKKVGSFWSPIADDVAQNPPPHSTGGAVDLTLCDADGIALDMGSEVDELVDASSASFYDNSATLYEKNRNLLQSVMLEVGFTQLPTEWWHFSYGDQLWAVDKKKKFAHYAMIEALDE